WQNLVNFGILPLTFVDESDFDVLESGDVLVLENIRSKIETTDTFDVEVKGKGIKIKAAHALSPRQVDIMKVGGLINRVKQSSPKQLKEGFLICKSNNVRHVKDTACKVMMKVGNMNVVFVMVLEK